MLVPMQFEVIQVIQELSTAGGAERVAWELARAWPDAQLHVIEDSGHTGSDAMRLRTRAALDEFAGRPA